MADLQINYDLPDEILINLDEELGKIKDYISGEWVKATPEEVNAIQLFAYRLVNDFGYSKNQIQTHPQFRIRRSPSDDSHTYPVDIAVFKNEEKIESNLLLIVECKQPSLKTGEKQLKICLDMCSAEIGVWFNGESHSYFRKTVVKKINNYFPIPIIPKNGQRIEDIGLFKRKDLIISKNLKNLFKDIRNKLSQQAVGITRDEVLAQEVMDILFCKLYDEINKGPDENIEFRIGVDENPDDVKTRIDYLFSKVKTEYSDIFEDNEQIELDKTSIAYIVGELQNFCIKDAERDVLGDAFEVFIGPALKGGQGQFFTPRNVVKFAVSVLDPNTSDLIIDPACGSGGFLIVALEHVWRKIYKDGKERGMSQQWIKGEQEKIASKIMRGIDKDAFLTKVTKAYMAIIGDGRGGIFCENSIDLTENWSNKTKDKISLENFNVVITNPPFGSKIPIDEKEILEKYQLGYKWKKNLPIWIKQTKLKDKQPPQIIFIERCLELLKPGGRMAIVLPDGVLGGSKIGYVSFFIKQKAKILALIDCSKKTFQPNTSTKTHLLFLEKITKDEKIGNYNIFMAKAQNVGHDSKGKTVFHKDSDIQNDDFPKILKKYELFKNGKLTKKNFDNLGFSISSQWVDNYLIVNRYLPKYMKGLQELEKLGNTNDFTLKSLKEIKENSRGLWTGANVPAKEYVEKSTLRYIMTDCITPFGINPSNFKFISKTAYDQNITKQLKKEDIVINRAGSPGISAIMTGDMAGVMACGFVFVLRVKKEYDSHYVAAFLNSRLGRLQTERLSFGSILEHMTKDDLLDIRIPFPTDKSKINKISNDYLKTVTLQESARKGFADTNSNFETYLKLE